MTHRPLALDSTSARRVLRRRILFFSLWLAAWATGTTLLALIHADSGWSISRVIHLLIFAPLFARLVLGALECGFGFFLRARGRPSPCLLPPLNRIEKETPVAQRVALVMPIFHEEVARVMTAVEVIYQSVQATGKMPNFDFFILSDSEDPNYWIEEESAWLALTTRLQAHGRIFYRKRRASINQKSGNLADFCRRWGDQYHAMVVLDADSVMTGEAVVELAQRLERNPSVGIIQGAPRLAYGESIFARAQQFAATMTGDISAAGLSYWQNGEGNYWGHNAIERLAPFIQHCSLPELPGAGPFSGRILSHDYVEAALMRRAGWQVWLAEDIEGNYEEGPASLLEFVQRDRRWLQGNLQHLHLLFAQGFHPVNRLHLALGILAYLASPLWLLFMLATAWIVGFAADGVLAGVPARTGVDGLGGLASLELGLYTLLLLVLPRIASLVDLARRPEKLAAIGGWIDAITSTLIEMLVSTLLAPVLMVFHTFFIALTLGGKKITWGSQKRGRAGERNVVQTLKLLWPLPLLGFACWVAIDLVSPELAVWMLPVNLGLLLSIPIAWLSNSIRIGLGLSAQGLLRTPVEATPPPELVAIKFLLAERNRGPTAPADLRADFGLLQAVIDPYINSTHVSLLRNKENQPPETVRRLAALRDLLVTQGPRALSEQDKRRLLFDPDSMNALHDAVWSSPRADLALWWQRALDYYSTVVSIPERALL